MDKIAALAEASKHTPLPLVAALAELGPYWAIEPNYARAAMSRLMQIDFASHAAQYAAAQAEFDAAMSRDDEEAAKQAYDLDVNGIATIRLSGVMTKRPSSWGRSCSTVQARRAVRLATWDDRVKAIALIIDSPGGNVDGTADLAADVLKARGVKPVGVYIEDCGCSAAYWVASQATFIWSNSTAMVGSIGTKCEIEDTSEAYAMMGIKVYNIATGPYKGGGTDGVPVTQEILDDYLRVATELNERFLASVSAGRGIKRKDLQTIADGRVHIGTNAKALGLVDRVATIDQFYTRLGNTKPDENEVLDTDDEDEGLLPDDPDDDAPGCPDAQTAGLAGMEGKLTMRQQFATALQKAGLNTWAAAILGADDTEDAIAAQLKAQAAADAQVRQAPVIAAATAEQEAMFAALATAGIKTPEDLTGVVALSKLGKEYDAEMRTSAKAEAVRAHGAELGARLAISCDSLPFGAVKQMRDAWRATADAKFGIGENGQAAEKKTAPAALAVAVNAEHGDKKPATLWDRLTADQQAIAKSMGADATPAKRELFAENYLKAKGEDI